VDRPVGLADRRGECIHAACTHYNRCFVEKSIRGAKRADIVVTNHALVMVQAAYGGKDDRRTPTRYVFDEGHHVFDAADSAFSAYLSGREAAELRHWVRGAEDGRRGRARGLKRRLEDIVAGDDNALADIEAALEAARALPGQGWENRLSSSQPLGSGETFFMHLRAALYLRVSDPDSLYDLQCELYPAPDNVVAAARDFGSALATLAVPLTRLINWLVKHLDDNADQLDSSQRARSKGQFAAWNCALAGRLALGKQCLPMLMAGRVTALLTGCRSTGWMAKIVMSGWRGTGLIPRSPLPIAFWIQRMASPSHRQLCKIMPPRVKQPIWRIMLNPALMQQPAA
jgi:ATP-dependent DNA helicase DinG